MKHVRFTYYYIYFLSASMRFFLSTFANARIPYSRRYAQLQTLYFTKYIYKKVEIKMKHVKLPTLEKTWRKNAITSHHTGYVESEMIHMRMLSLQSAIRSHEIRNYSFRISLAFRFVILFAAEWRNKNDIFGKYINYEVSREWQLH